MIYGLYCMRDAKTGFMQPVMEVNDQAAIRNFYHTVWNSEGILFSFAPDFTLYKVASFDAETGAVVPFSPIIQVADGAAALLAMRKEDQ